MKLVEIRNPFGAPVYHEKIVSSTMDVSRVLAEQGEPCGTVVLADFQESGRGRNKRVWTSGKGQNLMFTIFLRCRDVSALPTAFTLRAGLALALAIEEFFPVLAGRIKIKWPNDIMIFTGKKTGKAAGILAEAKDDLVFLGCGINLLQRNFPNELEEKAVSIMQVLEELNTPFNPAENSRIGLLEKILSRLYDELESHESESWKTRLEERLYKKGEDVVFVEGAADSGNEFRGRLEGIGDGGELLLVLHNEEAPHPFVTGELRVYS